MDPKILSLINTLYVVAFVILVGLAIARIGTRYLAYRKEELPIPYLLKRDFVFFTGLSLPFASLLVFRFAGISPIDQLWYPLWVIFSGGLALLGTAYWVYVEYFKIEK